MTSARFSMQGCATGGCQVWVRAAFAGESSGWQRTQWGCDWPGLVGEWGRVSGRQGVAVMGDTSFQGPGRGLLAGLSEPRARGLAQRTPEATIRCA